MKTKINCGCEKGVFVCRAHCKMQQVQHTPKVGLEGNPRDGQNFVLYWPDGKVRAKYLIGYPSDVQEWKFIVKAVNEHKPLQSRVKLLHEMIQENESLKAQKAALLEAAKHAFDWSCRRAESKCKWRVRDQLAHDKLKEAIDQAEESPGKPL